MQRALAMACVLALSLSGAATGSSSVAPSAPEDAPRTPRPIKRTPMPQRFVEEPSRPDVGAVWAVHGHERSVFVAAREARIVERSGTKGAAAAMEFVGARDDARLTPSELDAAVVNRLHGPRSAWRTGLRTARSLESRGVWPGIDVRWETGDGRAEYAFVVAPGADPSDVRLRWRGAESLRVAPSGELVVATAAGEIRDARPRAWTESVAGRVPVTVRWVLDRGATATFALGEYDAGATLVIDPAFVVSSGYLGGASTEDVATCIVSDAAGAAYVGGSTGSTDFPVTVGAFDTTLDGTPSSEGEYSPNGFVAKVRPDGSGFVWVTFLGGDGHDEIDGIALDSQGRVVVGGWTNTSETTFPVLGGPDLTFNGVSDVFVGRLAASGAALDWCGYIGGNQFDTAYAVGVDAADAVYVCGETHSTEPTFPVLVGPDLTYNGGFTDVFVAKVKADGSALDYCGFIGGDQREHGFGMSVTPGGVAVVVGQTGSTETTFPVVGGPDTTYNGSNDGFVARVKADGSALDLCGYVGGAQSDGLYDADVDADGNIYVCGYSYSNETTFPVAVGPDLTWAGQEDGVIAKITPAGAIVYCGYIGGDENNEEATSVEIDAQGRPIVVGYTTSSQQFDGFPVVVGPDLTFNGGQDAWTATVKADGSGFDSVGYIGGVDDERATAVAVSANGSIWVTGAVNSSQATFPVLGGPDLTHNGQQDAFVTRLSEDVLPPLVVTDSFIAPSFVKAHVDETTPTKSRGTVVGNLDVGTNDLDPAGETRVTIVGRQFDFPTLGLDARGKGFRLTNDDLDLRVKFSPRGGSASAFKLTLKGDLAAAVDPEDAFDLRFENGGVNAFGRVNLTGGAYRLAHPRGALLSPKLYVIAAAGTVKGPGKDTLALRAGFQTGSKAPFAVSEVEVSFGSGLHQTIDAASFVRSGDRWTYKGAPGGVTLLTLDYAKQTITLQAKKADFGAFDADRNPVELRVRIGDDSRAVRVLVGRRGAALGY